MTTFADTYLTGSPDDVLAVIAANPDAALIPPVEADGVMHACLRVPAGEALVMPAGRTDLSGLTAWPETARRLVGVFMAEPPPPTEPSPEPEEPLPNEG